MRTITKSKNADLKYAHYKFTKPDKVRISKIIKWAGSNNKILDIGCGAGFIGEKLRKNKNKVYGIDTSPKCLKKASEKGITCKQCDIEDEKIPFKEKFDVVIAAEIIEHVIDTDSFLQKIKTSLKPDGKLIITTPNAASLGRRILLLLGKNPILEYRAGGDNAGHLRYFTKHTLKQLLKENGYKIIKFESDIVNFDKQGKFSSKTLADLFPTLGKSLITEVAV